MSGNNGDAFTPATPPPVVAQLPTPSPHVRCING